MDSPEQRPVHAKCPVCGGNLCVEDFRDERKIVGCPSCGLRGPWGYSVENALSQFDVQCRADHCVLTLLKACQSASVYINNLDVGKRGYRQEVSRRLQDAIILAGARV